MPAFVWRAAQRKVQRHHDRSLTGCSLKPRQHAVLLRGERNASSQAQASAKKCTRNLYEMRHAGEHRNTMPVAVKVPRSETAAVEAQVLGVGASADGAAIKKAYRVEALKWHPGARSRGRWWPLCRFVFDTACEMAMQA